MPTLNTAEALCRKADGLVPRDLPPRVGDVLANQRRQHTIRVRGVAPRKASLHAGMPLVGTTIHGGHHAHDLIALHLRFERAPHAAVGAGGLYGALWLAGIDDRLFDECGRGTRLHAGAARYALAGEEPLVHAGAHFRGEAAVGDAERKGALNLVAGAHTARAHDALGRVEREVGITLVLFGHEMVGAVHAISHFAQPHRARHVLQLAVTVRRAREAIERVVGDVQLHHVAPHPRHLWRLRAHDHARLHRRGARRRQSASPIHLHDAQATRAERLERIGRAQFGDVHAHRTRGLHDAGTGRHAHRHAIHREFDHVITAMVDHSGLPPTGANRSAEKCVITLRTGSGVRPPRAHSDPSSIVSHSSSSSAHCFRDSSRRRSR